jgi:hypothetical protein
MKIKNSIDTLSCRMGNGRTVLIIGLPFFLMGSFFFWGGLTAEEINEAPPSVALRFGFCAFSSIFIFIGLSLIAGFKATKLDRRRQTLTCSWGILFPLYSKTEALPEVQSIEMTVEVRVSKNSDGASSRTTVYPVRLIQGSDKTTINEPLDLLAARALSENLSRFLNVPITDSSLGVKLFREVDELDASVSEMMKKYDETVPKPEVPQSLQGKVHEDYNHDCEKGTRVTFMRHAQRDPKIFSFFAGVSLLSLLALAYRFPPLLSANSVSVTDLFERCFSFFFLIPFVIFIASTRKVIFALVQASIMVSASKLTYSKSLLLSLKKTVPLNSLEHLLLREILQGKTAKLTLVSDKLCMDILEYHDLEDVRYVEQLIKYSTQAK